MPQSGVYSTIFTIIDGIGLSIVMRNKSGHAKTIRAAGKKDNKENDKQKKFDVKNKQNE
jgi:hypothetical protein